MTLIHSIKRGMAGAAIMLLTSTAAAALDLPVTNVNGKDYYYYDVQPNETLFSLSQRLGISRDEIVSYNPGVEGGVKAYTRLYFPVESGLSTIADGDNASATHTVMKGETLYGIAKKYGISIDRLIALNPSARDGIKQGEVLTVMQQEIAETPAAPAATNTGGTHTIASGETLYRIAVKNGITVDQLLAANPGLDAYNYTEGTVIAIPSPDSIVPASNASSLRAEATEVSVDNLASATRSVTPATPATPAAPVANTAERTAEADVADNTPAVSEATVDESERVTLAPGAVQKECFNIAVMLPFNLSEETPGKDAENFTEFYRGFLLAAQNLDKNGMPVHITAFDTAGGMDTVKNLMGREEMAQMDIFVTPPAAAEMDYIVSQIDEDRQFVFNNFAVRSESYKDNPNVLQANIPHTMMYSKAIDAFLSEMAGRTPIFIQRIGATADKEEFTSMLKTQLADRGIDYKEITYSNSLDAEDFEDFDITQSYVIVPLSASANEFNKIVPQAKKFKESLASPDGLAMFGYPEWLTFRGERQESLGALNATIYSRFFYDDTYYPARRVVEEYRTTYGREMSPAVPSQALMGYDVATYIINSLRKNNGDYHIEKLPYDGLQSDFIFTDSDCEGLVNTAVEVIKFRDGGFTEHRRI
ncbi:MAG: LysM peptidoglycan-binding domain-containing protein [Barnesiella sp.]|nr:LysM peptidoglycan-binding domain-containing protein [Barnesiella sp.]